MIDLLAYLVAASSVWGHPCDSEKFRFVIRDLPGNGIGFAAKDSDGRCLLAVDPHAFLLSDGRFCRLLIHEFGHLAGRGHSRYGNRVMYHRINRGDSRCRDRARQSP